jgi:hypothetical protein
LKLEKWKNCEKNEEKLENLEVGKGGVELLRCGVGNFRVYGNNNK